MAKSIDLWGKTYQLPPKGMYAGQPGKGPEGTKCRDCEHFARMHMSKTYFKCKRMDRFWTNGKATDIQATAPSCEWFAAMSHKVHVAQKSGLSTMISKEK